MIYLEQHTHIPLKERENLPRNTPILCSVNSLTHPPTHTRTVSLRLFPRTSPHRARLRGDSQITDLL